MTDDEIAAGERKGLLAMLSLTATARELAPQAVSDARYMAAANSIRQIAATLDQIDDAALLKLAHVNRASDGVLLALIAARIEQVGFALPLCEDAAEFFAPIEAKVDTILLHARRDHLH